MKKIFYTLPLLLLVLSLSFIHTGCQEDEIITPVDENVDKEAVISKNSIELTKIFADANSYVWLYENDVTPSGCPDYFFSSSLDAFVVTYGEYPFGCTGVDGVKRNGSLVITTQVFSGGDSLYSFLAFNNYKVDKYATAVDTNTIRLNGIFNFSSKKVSGTTYTFHAGGEGSITTNLGVAKTVTVNSISGTVNYNSLGIVSDDAYSMYGSLRIVDSGFGLTYDVSVTQSNALQIAGSCLYPLTGTARVGSSNCDFSPNGGACDAIVKISKGSTTKEVDLTNTDF